VINLATLSRRPLPRRIVALALVLATTSQPASAQEPTRPAPREDDRASRLDEMRQIASAFQAVSIRAQKRARLEMARDPLHRWSDPTREFSDATLWAWRSAGRPEAVMTIEFYPDKTSLEFVSLSTSLVEAQDGRLHWAPQKPGLDFKPVPAAPVPAAGAAERLRQTRDLVKRFSASEFWDVTSQSYQLRALAHPIDRYADQGSGILDGAIFVYANGTNPEVLLVLEARQDGNGPPVWFYAAAPLTTAAPTLKLDRHDVWTSPNKYGYLSHETYFFVEKPRRQPVR
jgi:hypothetical protein